MEALLKIGRSVSVRYRPRHFRPNSTSVHQTIYVTTLTVLLHSQLSILTVLDRSQLSMLGIEQMFYVTILTLLLRPQLSMLGIK